MWNRAVDILGYLYMLTKRRFRGVEWLQGCTDSEGLCHNPGWLITLEGYDL